MFFFFFLLFFFPLSFSLGSLPLTQCERARGGPIEDGEWLLRERERERWGPGGVMGKERIPVRFEKLRSEDPRELANVWGPLFPMFFVLLL